MTHTISSTLIPPPSIRGILLCYSLSVFASAMPAALFYFYVRDVLHAEPDLVTFLILYIGAGLVTLPLWKKFAQHIGPARTWLGAMLFTAIVFIGVCFLGKGDVMPYSIICLLSGLTFGAEFFLPVMLLKRGIEAANEEHHSIRHYGTLALVGKIVATLGCIPAIPFVAEMAMPPDVSKLLLVGMYGLLPCLIKAGAAYGLWQWLKTYGGNNEKPFGRGGADVA